MLIMSTLKLIVDHGKSFADLIQAFQGLLEVHMETEISGYGTAETYRSEMVLVYVRNTDTGSEFRIIFDPNGRMKHRQGIHTTTECDEYELCDFVDQADRDSFDTIWVHV